MIHQRNILRVFYILAALAAFAFGGIIGSFFVSVILMAIVSLPVVYVIKKIFPAPDWYANEDEKSEMTSLNLSNRDKSIEK
ncbi:MAG TPA: hypothetical protein PKY82_29285 [Pyrinomonadaceae bacterium]|nr:hypothetical protein [Pyrinomonadaceae bacterium]